MVKTLRASSTHVELTSMKPENLLTIFALLTFPLLGISAFIVVYLERKYNTKLLTNLRNLHDDS